LDRCLTRVDGQWRVRRSPYACAAGVFMRLTRDKGPTFVSAMRDAVLRFCCEQSVPIPPVGWGMEIGKDRPVTPHSALN
jgi:hypothetical protein